MASMLANRASFAARVASVSEEGGVLDRYNGLRRQPAWGKRGGGATVGARRNGGGRAAGPAVCSRSLRPGRSTVPVSPEHGRINSLEVRAVERLNRKLNSNVIALMLDTKAMVARGDVGAELPIEEVIPSLQDQGAYSGDRLKGLAYAMAMACPALLVAPHEATAMVVESGEILRLSAAEIDPGTAKLAITVLGPVFATFNLMFIVRIVMSWYPQIPVGKFPFSIAYAPTEPVLGPTRRLIPPVGGVDVAPVIWVALMSFLNEILLGQQGLLVLLSQQQP